MTQEEFLDKCHCQLNHFVGRIARDTPWLDLDDIKQSGWLLLLEAYQRFDASLGCLPNTFTWNVLRFRLRELVLRDVGYQVARIHGGPRAYAIASSLEDDSGDGVSLRELVPSPDINERHEQAMDLRKCFEVVLTPRERDVLYRQFFRGDRDIDIAKVHKVSSSLISRISSKAKQKMRQYLEQDGM